MKCIRLIIILQVQRLIIEGATYIEGDTRDIAKLVKQPDHISLGRIRSCRKRVLKILRWCGGQIKTDFAVLEFGTRAKIVYAGSSTKFGMELGQRPESVCVDEG